jgi:hypothetical protein
MSELTASTALDELLVTALDHNWTLHSSPESIKLGVVEWRRVNATDQRKRERLHVVHDLVGNLTSVWWKPSLSVSGFRWTVGHWELLVRRCTLHDVALRYLRRGSST